MMELAPIVIFSYNRPDHLSKVLDALAKNDLASESVLYIYCDGAKETASEEEQDRIRRNREVAHLAIGFKELHVIERPTNIGLKDNIIGAVTEIVNSYGRIITLEDDVVTSKGFLRYMNDALEVYKDEDRVMHISSYMWPHRWTLPETFFFEVPYPGGGWATWKRAWVHYSDDSEELYNYWKNDWKRFDKFGDNYLSKQLIANYQGTMRTWFIKWHAVMLRRNALTLYPRQSLTNNIGFDDLATNCYATNKFDVLDLAEYIKVKPCLLKENWLGANEIYAFYQGRWYNKRRRLAMTRKILRFLHLCYLNE